MPKPQHPGRAGNNVSLAPLTTEQAFAAMAKVKLTDVKKLEAAEKPKKGKKRKA